MPPVATTVGLRVITFVDHTRVERFRNGRVEPRTLVTQIRYPALGTTTSDEVPAIARIAASAASRRTAGRGVAARRAGIGCGASGKSSRIPGCNHAGR